MLNQDIYEEQKKEDEANLASVEVALELSKSVYEEELARFNQIESKTNISMAFTGVLLGVLITYFGEQTIENNTPHLIYSFASRLAILATVVTGLYYLYQSMRSGKYNQISPTKFVSEERFKQDEIYIKADLAYSYKRVVMDNKALLEKKAENFNKGTRIVSTGFVFFIFYFLIEGLIKHV